MFKNFFKEAAATGKLRIASVLETDEIPLIAGADVAGAAAAVLLDFDAYAGQVDTTIPLLLRHPRLSANRCRPHYLSFGKNLCVVMRLAAAQALLLVAQMLTVDGLAAAFSKVLGKPVSAPPCQALLGWQSIAPPQDPLNALVSPVA